MAAGRVAAIGAEPEIAGFALAGAVVTPADTPGEMRAAWVALEPDVVLVLLTAPAAAVLATELDDPASDRLIAVLPA